MPSIGTLPPALGAGRCRWLNSYTLLWLEHLCNMTFQYNTLLIFTWDSVFLVVFFKGNSFDTRLLCYKKQISKKHEAEIRQKLRKN